MIDYSAALALLRQHGAAALRPSETVPTALAAGRIAAAAVASPIAVPSFANSAMDGFALDHRLTTGASKDAPLTLPVAAIIAAGDQASTAQSGTACEIMTGAQMPGGCDAVIPVENVQLQRNEAGQVTAITFDRPVPASDNVRHAGEDFQPGLPILAAGQRITPAHVMALAATGVASVSVRGMPKVALLATGKELVDLPTDTNAPALTGSQIYNSNAPYLAALLAEAGIAAEYLGQVPDEVEVFVRFLRNSTDAQVVISTGAVSKGKWDFIPDTLRAEGAEILFHRVAIKPGKPILFARLADGRFFLGLPGNPVASAVGLRFFVAPLLRALLGLPEETQQPARLAADWKGKAGLQLFLKAKVGVNAEGQREVQALDGQESFKVSPLAAMNAWLVLPADAGSVAAGTPVAVYPPNLLGDPA